MSAVVHFNTKLNLSKERFAEVNRSQCKKNDQKNFVEENGFQFKWTHFIWRKIC